jgi:hypothetical protein
MSVAVPVSAPAQRVKDLGLLGMMISVEGGADGAAIA